MATGGAPAVTGDPGASSATERGDIRTPTDQNEQNEPTKRRIMPVFLLNDTLPNFDSSRYTVVEICENAEKVAGIDSLEGAQLIKNLWSLYPKSNEARMSLLSGGIELRGSTIYPRDTNPYLPRDNGGSRPLPTTKLTIGNIPLSFPNTEIEEALNRLPTLVAASGLFEERGRDSTGKLRKWKTGRRYLYIVVPPEPLPKSLAIGKHKAYLSHAEQFRDRACQNCLRAGHPTYQCTSAVRCRACHQEGHRAGAPECSLTPPHTSENSLAVNEMTSGTSTTVSLLPPPPSFSSPPPPHSPPSANATDQNKDAEPQEGRGRSRTKQTTIDRARLLVAKRAISRSKSTSRSETVGELPTRSPSGKRSRSQRRNSGSKERRSKQRKTTELELNTEKNNDESKDSKEPEEQKEGNDT